MKKTIAVVFGGRSAEHDVSIITGHIPIIQSLQAGGVFDIVPIYIAKNGNWYSDAKMNDLAFFQRDGYEEDLKKLRPVNLSFEGGLQVVWPGLRQKRARIDIVFPAMHGTYGEDGSLMGLLRMAGAAFVGCDLFASAVAMDKVLTKQVISSEGIPVVPYVWFTKTDWQSSASFWKEKIGKLKLPLFIKPVHLGSSIAITKIKELSRLDDAVEVALHYDDKVLVEEGIEDLIEVTLPIMGNERLRLGGIERPLNKTEFFDFQDKYLKGGKKGGGVNTQYSEIPANISQKLSAQVADLGSRTYKVLGCSGIARVDFLIDAGTKRVYVNEVNTLPGSLYHHNWRKMGVSGTELVSELVRLAEERFKATRDTNYTFDSDVLKKIGGQKASQ